MKPFVPDGNNALIRNAESNLSQGGMDLDSILITLVILNRLSDKFHFIR